MKELGFDWKSGGGGGFHVVDSQTPPPIPSAWGEEHFLRISAVELLKLDHPILFSTLLVLILVLPRTETLITEQINELGEVSLLEVFVA